MEVTMAKLSGMTGFGNGFSGLKPIVNNKGICGDKSKLEKTPSVKMGELQKSKLVDKNAGKIQVSTDGTNERMGVSGKGVVSVKSPHKIQLSQSSKMQNVGPNK